MIKPLGARVLVRKVGIEEVETDSGIVLPQPSEEKTHKAEVIAIGPEVTEGLLKVDDLVIVTFLSGDEVRDGAETYFLIEEVDLLATIDR